MSVYHMRLRKADLSDSNDILSWRNDETTRRFSVNKDVVSQGEHDKWFRRKLDDPDTDFYIGIDGDCKLGLVRIERTAENTAEVHINMNPEFRGRGLGTGLLGEAVALGLKKYERLIARVFTDNPASVRIFEKAGFVRIVENGGLTEYAIER